MVVLAARARYPRRRPGVYFEASPPRGEALPRMDIPVFVGLARSGPLHVPVAVEDAVTFGDLFGDDLTLAVDRAEGADIRSNLGAAVRAFFRSGGKRCWVVRVADASAETSTFPIPGLVACAGGTSGLGPTATLVQASALARSPGSWADDLTASAALLATEVPVVAMSQTGPETATLSVTLAAGESVIPGDLVRVRREAQQRTCFLHVASVAPGPRTESGPTFVLTGTPFWVRDPVLDLVPGPAAALGAAAEVEVGAAPAWELLARAGEAPEVGSLVPFSQAGRTLFLFVERASLESRASGLVFRLVGRCLEWIGSALPSGEGLATPGLVAHLLRFEMWAWPSGLAPLRAGDLAFSPRHPRYWGRLPSDETLFLDRLRVPAPAADSDVPSGDSGASRFPLSGDPSAPYISPEQWDAASAGVAPFPGGAPPPLFLPLGMQPAPVAKARAKRSTQDTAVRDGVSRFPLSAFLDADIASGAGATSALLAGWADYRRYTAADGQRRHLQGLFAAFSVPEASLLALPDVVHPDWELQDIPLPPAFEPPIVTAGGGLSLAWRTEEVSTAPFSVEMVSPDGTVTLASAPAPHLEIPPGRAPGLYRYRVRGAGAWSPPLSFAQAEADASVFADCQSLEAPALIGPETAPEDVAFDLGWTVLPSTDVTYSIEESEDPGFSRTAALYAGTGWDLAETGDVHFTVQGRRGGDYYFRLRATRNAGTSGTLAASSATASTTATTGTEAAFSRGLLVRVRPRGRRVEILPVDPAAPSATALLLHQHALRLCAARGDMMAILSLPVRYREDAAARHAAALLDAFGDTEPSVLGFGAVYHPWIVARDVRPSQAADDTTAPLRKIPPDGAACGALASTAASRGAWIASANRTVPGALSLTPVLLESREDELSSRQINLLRRDARGVVIASEDTLSLVPELLPIHVRRLLILLGRAALDLGATYAFEPNGAALERRVARTFGDFLRRLHDRGAFAGATFDSAVRLTITSGDSSPADADLGRFTVDIAVAPADAVEVITVRLVQSGSQGRVTSGG